MSHRHHHRITGSEYHLRRCYILRHSHALFWLSLLLVTYTLNRICCIFGLPADGQHHTYLGHCRNLSDLILLGFIQAWFVEVVDGAGRTDRMLSSRWFIPLFLLSGPVFAGLGMVPWFDFAIESGSAAPCVLLVVGGTAIAAIIVYHLFLAREVLFTRRDILAYTFSRLGTVGILSAMYILIQSESTDRGQAKLHLHHYFIAWVLSLFAAFDSAVSLGFLAITGGVFVQGIAAYSAASMFYRTGDLPCPEYSSLVT